nr:probable methyltransferase PMT13 [Ipomoea batatas]
MFILSNFQILFARKSEDEDSKLGRRKDKKKCNLVDLMVEIDRMLRPEGSVVIRDSPEVIDKSERIAHAVRWTTSIYEKEPGSNGREKILVATKKLWNLSSTSSH